MNHFNKEEISFPYANLHAVGVTLIELLVALCIAAILLAVAIPAFDSILQANRFATLSNAFVTNLHMARSEATRRNARVTLCKSSDGASCTNSGYWSQGWIVFHDVNNNAQIDAGEEILRIHEPIASSLVLKGNAPVAHYVSYAAMGGSRMTSGAFQAGTFTLCRQSTMSSEAREIVISATGRPRVQTTTVAACP